MATHAVRSATAKWSASKKESTKEVNMKEEIPEESVQNKEPNPGDPDELIRQVSKIPGEIKAREAKLHALSRKTALLNQQIKEMEDNVYLKVALEKDLDGKNKYTNEKSRETETNKRLWLNTDYKLLKEEESKTLQDTHETKSDVDYYRREMKSIEIITELLKIKLRIP